MIPCGFSLSMWFLLNDRTILQPYTRFLFTWMVMNPAPIQMMREYLFIVHLCWMFIDCHMQSNLSPFIYEKSKLTSLSSFKLTAYICVWGRIIIIIQLSRLWKFLFLKKKICNLHCSNVLFIIILFMRYIFICWLCNVNLFKWKVCGGDKTRKNF